MHEAKRGGVRLLEWIMVVQLLRSGERVTGALALDRAGNMMRIRAGAVVLACGGGGRLYPDSDNTLEMAGDGFALAWEAGAELHPAGDDKRWLGSLRVSRYVEEGCHFFVSAG